MPSKSEHTFNLKELKEVVAFLGGKTDIMVLADQLIGNFLIFAFVGWMAMRVFHQEQNLTGVVILAAVLAFLAPIFGSSASAEPWTLAAVVLFAVFTAQYALQSSWVETIAVIAIIWVFGSALVGMSF